MMIDDGLAILKRNASLSQDQSEAILNQILSGTVSESEILSLLSLMSQKGESVDEIVGFALAMRSHMNTVPLASDAVDTCGTGGSGRSRFNISTASAFAISACGQGVAKHGNVGSSTPNGSFDFLDALKVPYLIPLDSIPSLYAQTQCCFLFAKAHHPAMRHVASARKKWGKRSVFNLLGPLCNPARVGFQVVGTTSIHTAMLLANSFQRLGIQRVMIVIGHDGLDEATLSGPSQLIIVEPSSTHTLTIHPEDYGLSIVNEASFSGTAQENAALFSQLLSNPESTHPVIQMMALNSGLALWCVGRVKSLKDGVSTVLDAIMTKRVWEQFLTYKLVAQRLV